MKCRRTCQAFFAATTILITSCASCPTPSELQDKIKRLEKRIEVMEGQLSESEKDLEVCIQLLDDCDAVVPNN